MTQNYTSITLGELLSSGNEMIRRNAMSIYKTLIKKDKMICLHQFIPDDNEGCYGHEICRFCGKKEHN